MPEATLATFNLETATPSELEQRRRNIIAQYGAVGFSSSDLQAIQKELDRMSVEHLTELAAITSALRRRTATAPKSGKKAGTKRVAKSTATVDDIFSQL